MLVHSFVYSFCFYVCFLKLSDASADDAQLFSTQPEVSGLPQFTRLKHLTKTSLVAETVREDVDHKSPLPETLHPRHFPSVHNASNTVSVLPTESAAAKLLSVPAKIDAPLETAVHRSGLQQLTSHETAVSASSFTTEGTDNHAESLSPSLTKTVLPTESSGLIFTKTKSLQPDAGSSSLSTFTTLPVLVASKITSVTTSDASTGTISTGAALLPFSTDDVYKNPFSILISETTSKASVVDLTTGITTQPITVSLTKTDPSAFVNNLSSPHILLAGVAVTLTLGSILHFVRKFYMASNNISPYHGYRTAWREAYSSGSAALHRATANIAPSVFGRPREVEYSPL